MNADSFFETARKGDLEKMRALLKDDPDLVFSKDEKGRTPLHWAAGQDRKDVADFLLANRAEVDAKAIGRLTPLHYAALNGHTGVAGLLLARGADVNARAEDDKRPLHLAAGGGYKEVAELLLVNRAELNATALQGVTPLHMATRSGHKKVAELLLAKQANIRLVSGVQCPACDSNRQQTTDAPGIVVEGTRRRILQCKGCGAIWTPGGVGWQSWILTAWGAVLLCLGIGLLVNEPTRGGRALFMIVILAIPALWIGVSGFFKKGRRANMLVKGSRQESASAN